MRWPKLNGHRKTMLALVFFGPGVATWAPYFAGSQTNPWLAGSLHLSAFFGACLLYFFTWRSDDKLLSFVDAIRRQPAWNVWLTIGGKRELLGVVHGTEEGAFRFGKQELLNRCWNSELGVVAGQVDVEGPLP